MNPTEPIPPSPGPLIRRALRRRWAPILTQWALLTTALLATGLVLLHGPYEASSLLRVGPIAAAGPSGIPADSRPSETLLPTLVELVVSPDVLAAAAKDPKVAALPRFRGAADPGAVVGEAIRAAVIPGTDLIRVSARSSSPAEAATLVDATVDAFLEVDAEWSNGITRDQIKKLEDYLADLTVQSEELDRRWKALVARGEVGPRLAGLRAPANQPGAPGAVPEEGEGKDRRRATDAVDIALVREQRDGLRGMRETTVRRLEQLKLAERGETRVRRMNRATPPRRPTGLWYRPLVLLAIPFATFAAVLGLFASIEARSRPAASTGKDGPPKGQDTEV